jgi:hypothetical protein
MWFCGRVFGMCKVMTSIPSTTKENKKELSGPKDKNKLFQNGLENLATLKKLTNN